jgi:hypothetical protein
MTGKGHFYYLSTETVGNSYTSVYQSLHPATVQMGKVLGG